MCSVIKIKWKELALQDNMNLYRLKVYIQYLYFRPLIYHIEDLEGVKDLLE